MALRGDDEKLLEMGFSRPWRDVAISVIAGRLINPCSELETHWWLRYKSEGKLKCVEASVNSKLSSFPAIFLFPFVNKNGHRIRRDFEIPANGIGNVLHQTPLLFDCSSFIHFDNHGGHILSFLFVFPYTIKHAGLQIQI